MTNENVSDLLRQSMNQAMDSAQQRLTEVIPFDRQTARARLREDLIKLNPIVVLGKRIRARDYMVTFNDLQTPEQQSYFNSLLFDIQVINRWVRRFGAQGGNWRT